ncbi:AAA family ATPase [Clostridium sp.]|uniref:AAA family ATPase n=1 Tax=Clostridium sp. TaxID=1506 RepID=UPI003463CE00
MMRVLKQEDVIYDFQLKDLDLNKRGDIICEYKDIYNKISDLLAINSDNFNIYLIDDYSMDKILHLKSYIENIYKKKESPRDICYVIYENDRSPKVLYLNNGMGKKLKKALEKLQNNLNEAVYKFYNSTAFKEKENILDDLHKKRAEIVEDLMEKAKKDGFDIKATTHGFAFLPLKNEGESMTTKEYDDLDLLIREDILSKVGKLKLMAENVLEDLKKLEASSIDMIKTILNEYLEDIIEEEKISFHKFLEDDLESIKYLEYVTNSLKDALIEIFTGIYEDDEEKITSAIFKYNINVLVDNTDNSHPVVHFEENPSVDNLIGEIEYENQNGTYITDVTMINAGSLLKCNEGVLIVRLIDLINGIGAYNHLKKSLLRGKVNFNYHRGYLDLLSISGLKTEDIDIKVKVIIVGDVESYDILYGYDEDFKRAFALKAESNPLIPINDEGKIEFIERINRIVDNYNLFDLTSKAVIEMAKISSRKAEHRSKLFIEERDISRILNLAQVKAIKDNRAFIDDIHIKEIVYEKDVIEKETLKIYEEGSILLKVTGERVGAINGLSVVGTEYYSFGRPMRITCVCYKGSGHIIDVQRESKLSGSIHEKSLNILRAYLNEITNPYKELPVDFHLSFEQVYGKIDGDSASVAETICMLSALSKIPIKQNIAVTGSINQFGEVQPIGGVNEKIEGFFNICKLIDKVEGKGVLIPESNLNNLVLNHEVEDAIKDGSFTIYTMNSIKDAIEVLMGSDENSVDNIFKEINEELNKYHTKEDKK